MYSLITFLIPTYNYICTRLVRDLQAQASELKSSAGSSFDYEIIVGDDGSTSYETVLENREINDLPGCRYVEHAGNVGRAFIRNWLISMAHYRWVVLIDSDAEVCTTDFVSRYWEHRCDADVVCGTLRNLAGSCKRGCELRYRYEQKAERWRNRRTYDNSPYLRLSTFNVMLNLDRLGDLRLDTRCSEYGYEDSLLGLTLRERGLTIKHIDNPLIHTGIDTNASFLSKTEAAMRTLHRLEGLMQEYAGTSRVYNALRLVHLDSAFRACFQLVRPLILLNLKGRHPSIKLFQLYKLGYYSVIDACERRKDRMRYESENI